MPWPPQHREGQQCAVRLSYNAASQEPARCRRNAVAGDSGPSGAHGDPVSKFSRTSAPYTKTCVAVYVAVHWLCVCMMLAASFHADMHICCSFSESNSSTQAGKTPLTGRPEPGLIFLDLLTRRHFFVTDLNIINQEPRVHVGLVDAHASFSVGLIPTQYVLDTRQAVIVRQTCCGTCRRAGSTARLCSVQLRCPLCRRVPRSNFRRSKLFRRAI